MRIPNFSHEHLVERLSYNKDTGVFLWKKLYRSTSIGLMAGTVDSYGRRLIGIHRRQYFEHRLAWFYVYGEFPTKDIDHINGNNADNRIANLRLATHAENMQNHTKARSDSTSKLIGAMPHQGRWRSDIRINGKKKFLGSFSTKEEAHNAYLKAKREIHHFCTI